MIQFMKFFSRIFVLVLAALSILPIVSCQRGPSLSGSNAIDLVTFGDASSEKSHQVAADNAEVIKGALDEPAVRLLPLTPPTHNGGSVAFTMKVDPQKQNYVTARLWGGDKDSQSGQLVLYAEGKQVGYRMQSDYDLLNVTDDEAQAPGRFIYETRPLPLWMTQGKDTINLKIAALGPHWPYGQTFDKYQKKLEQPSRGIYTAYTHTDPRIQPPSAEKMGQAPEAKLRSEAGAGGSEQAIAKTKEVVVGRINKVLASKPSGKWNNLGLLSEAYNVPWTPAYKNPASVELVVAEGDTLAAVMTTDESIGKDWSAAGPLGDAIARMWPEIAGYLDQPFQGKEGAVTRREAWSNSLRKSVDYWRTHRRSYTNQAMIVDAGIYSSNKGLELIAPDKALPEDQALRYAREAAGIDVWLDSDIVDANGERPSDPFKGNYYVVSKKGLSRELGWVGSYGETILHWTRDLFERTGNEDIRKQLAKLQDARLIFRYPGYDADGYKSFKVPAEVCNRTSHFPYAGPAYSAAAVRESWGMDVAAVVPEDPMAVGVAQRMIADGQYFPRIESRLKDPDTVGMMRNVDEYEKVGKLPPVSYAFPMEDGQPDFVFSDEENAIVALKHGDKRIFANFYYRAENAVNNVAKILEIDPKSMRLVTARTDTKVNESGQTYTRPDYINWIRGDSNKPPDEVIHQAWAGEKLPVARMPEGVPQGKAVKFGPYIGRADFYWLQYGDFLFGLNTTGDKTFDLPVPDGSYIDLVTDTAVKPESGVVKVGPLSTVVLYPSK